jgi:uncharacterized protein YndB with AHSA1/START domain
MQLTPSHTPRTSLVSLALAAGLLLACAAEAPSLPPVAPSAPAAAPPPRFIDFTIDQELVLPGPPEEIWDAMTGDVSGWWDHSFSEKPKKLYIEAKPGGGFYEIFDDAGNGALHATVIYAHRGKRLRLNGPLGLSGMPVEMVYTLDFEAVDGGQTRIKLHVHGAGPIDTTTVDLVKKVWNHFLVEQFKPYIESGKHRATKATPAVL